MKILIILPNWLGDAVMATAAIELMSQYYQDASFTFVGSYVSIQALKCHPKCEKAVVDETKKSSSRLLATYKLAKELGKFDIAITFRNQIHSSLLLKFTGTKFCIAKRAWHSMFLLSITPNISSTTQHLAQQYAKLAMTNIPQWNNKTSNLKLHIKAFEFEKPTICINGGAAYGSAKRWYPDRFAKVAKEFSNDYNIVILGAPNELDIANEIEENLISLGVGNYLNIAGKTNVEELCANIAGCSLLLTNDSGPMHIAAAFQTPTVAIIGPTEYKQTYPWMNDKGLIVRREMDCSPCVKRECPLKHHNCMKEIEPDEVIDVVKSLL